MNEKDETLVDLYRRSFPIVAAYVKKRGGDYETAKDIFQDAFIIYLEKKSREEITAPVSYITGIAKHLWFKQSTQKTDSFQTPDRSEDSESYADPKKLFLLLQHQGRKCLELLNAFYYENLTMSDIAANFSFSGERSATVQKYKCIEKLRQYVKNHSLTRDYFYETN